MYPTEECSLDNHDNDRAVDLQTLSGAIVVRHSHAPIPRVRVPFTYSLAGQTHRQYKGSENEEEEDRTDDGRMEKLLKGSFASAGPQLYIVGLGNVNYGEKVL